MTPLHSAAREGNIENVRSHLKEGADVHALDDLGRTALYYAAFARCAEAVTALLAAGSDPNWGDEGGITPLMAAIGMYDVRDFDYCVGPHFVLIPTPEKEDRTVQALLAGGANPDLADAAGRTAVHHAARKLNVSVFALLRDAGACLDPRDETGWEPKDYLEDHLLALTSDYQRPDIVAAHDRIMEMIQAPRR